MSQKTTIVNMVLVKTSHLGVVVLGAEMGNELTYQWQLRALGAYLDQEPSCRITLIETADGFSARLYREITSPDAVTVALARDALVEQLHTLIDAPKRGAKTQHQGIWRHFASGHQDFFRAVGFELDQESAMNVVIDELDDGLLLTYSCPDAASGGWRKRMSVLGLADMEAILTAAFGRRKAWPSLMPRW